MGLGQSRIQPHDPHRIRWAARWFRGKHVIGKSKSGIVTAVASEWSEPATWSMGLLQDSDWSADYISYRDDTPVFKDRRPIFCRPHVTIARSSRTEKTIQRATVYATALGIYELELNGQRVGDAYFAPGWTDYRQRAYYNTYDVTDLVEHGENAIGASVADGWYSGYVGLRSADRNRHREDRSVHVRQDAGLDGATGNRIRRRLAADRSRPTSRGKSPATGRSAQADLLMGESYDARLEMPGWSKPGFDDSGWEAAILAEENGRAASHVLRVSQSAQIRRTQRSRP